MEFVRDRVQTDIDYADLLKTRITKGTATTDEISEWENARLKGRYTYTDLNRVGSDLIEIKAQAQNAGITVTYPTTPVTNWTRTAVPTAEQMGQYLANLNAVKTAFDITVDDYPTSMVNLTIKGANAIENMLYEAYSSMVLADADGNVLVDENDNEIMVGG